MVYPCFLLFFMLLILYIRIHYQIQGPEDLPLFSSRSFIILTLTCRSLNHFELVVIYSVRVQIHSFCNHSIVPDVFVEETCIFPLNGLGILVEYQLTVDTWPYFWAFKSVFLVYMSFLMPAPHCLMTVAL